MAGIRKFIAKVPETGLFVDVSRRERARTVRTSENPLISVYVGFVEKISI